MELKEFITQALVDIHAGVGAANDAVNPGKGPGSPDRISYFELPAGVDKKAGEGIHFDVAVTTRQEGSTGGKLGARIAVVHASVGGEHASGSEHVSRLTFSVRVGNWIV